MSETVRILILDDEESVLKSTSMWLRGEGFEVFTANTVEQAIDILKENEIAVCLIDLRLRDESGLNVAKQLKAIDNLIRVIIITGFPTYDTAIKAMKAGIFDYVSKSANHNTILKKIQNAVDDRNTLLNWKKKTQEDLKNIILIGHHLLFKEGLESFCAKNPEFNLLHNYYSVDHIKKTDFNFHASLLLICAVCNQDFIDTQEDLFQRLKVFFPKAKIVIINCGWEENAKEKLLRRGVRGFLPPNIDKARMKRALDCILSGEFWVSRRLTDKILAELLVDAVDREYTKPLNKFGLSNREIEILQVMASGLSNYEISEKLFLSEKTVKTHIHHIFKKMEVKTRTEAVMKSIKNHII